MTTNALTLIAPGCTCCTEPAKLLPRNDLPGGLAACPNTGQLYRPEGNHYVPTALPALRSAQPTASIAIDLSREGYA
jgi:hypothetical protein